MQESFGKGKEGEKINQTLGIPSGQPGSQALDRKPLSRAEAPAQGLRRGGEGFGCSLL